MIILYIAATLVALGLFGYLLVALLAPEVLE
jgi:K+-transporting ATPase KdpF subunit